MEEGQRGYQAADSHQQVGIGHGLDEVAGGVVVQQRGTVEDEDHHQVASNDEHGEKEDDNHLQHAGIQAVGVTNSAQQAERGRTTLVHIGGRVHVWIGGGREGEARGPVSVTGSRHPVIQVSFFNPEVARPILCSKNKASCSS